MPYFGEQQVSVLALLEQEIAVAMEKKYLFNF